MFSVEMGTNEALGQCTPPPRNVLAVPDTDPDTYPDPEP